MNIGNVLRAWDVITGAQLSDALKHQREHPDMKLGEVIVSMGFATPDQIQLCLAKQEALRSGRAALPDISRMADYTTRCTEEASERLERMGQVFPRLLPNPHKK